MEKELPDDIKEARYALECQIKDNFVTLAGEMTTIADVNDYNFTIWVKEAIAKIGYTSEYAKKWGKENTICSDDIVLTTHISKQSPDIAQGVDRQGWGDQGIFTGYAEVSSNFYMPKDKELARDLGMRLYKEALEGVGGLDIKTQISLDGDKVKQIIVAVPVLDDNELEEVKSSVQFWAEVRQGINYLSEDDIIVNGTGAYKIHGPVGDSGTTGRKLAVDFYGNNAPIGGGSPWTKDYTKADLTLNLYSRHKALELLFDEYSTNNNVHHVIYQTSCCIGKDKLISNAKVYDKDDKTNSKQNETKTKNKDLFQKMVSFNPNQRPSIDEILNHPWFQLEYASVEEVNNEFNQRKLLL